MRLLLWFAIGVTDVSLCVRVVIEYMYLKCWCIVYSLAITIICGLLILLRFPFSLDSLADIDIDIDF